MGKMIYNKSQKSFIVEKESVVRIKQGTCEEIVDVFNNATTRIPPEAVVELTDEKADKLLSMYKNELVPWGYDRQEEPVKKPEDKKKKKG